MTVAETQGELAIRQRLKDDFAHYANRCLKIRAKSGAVVPLKLNRVQAYLHRRLEAQLAETGRVRALILKGRQQGCSTYVEGRYYWRVTHQRGVRAFILTHEQEASNNLFEMAERFHAHCPPVIRPHIGAANAKELHFDRLDSGYKVGTAGTKGVGRSSTVQFFHGSEVAFWPFAETHAAGVLQAIPEQPGTEIILESTANGIGNFFHAQWQAAEAGTSDYIAIFIPWFWQSEYRKPVPEGFQPSQAESEYQSAYRLDLEQIAWRRAKIAELKDEWLFRQEYPATAAEAFQSSGADGLIAPSLVTKARGAEAAASGPLVVGVDPARFGDDRTAIVRRRGRQAFGLESHVRLDTMAVAGLVARIIEGEAPKRVFIDVVGLGAGVVDRLNELGYGQVVEAVNGGERPLNRDRYLNRRAEMWALLREWLADAAGVQVPDSDSLHADLCAPSYGYDSAGRLRLERKEEMKARGLRSPDEADALALTFAAPVAPSNWDEPIDYRHSGKWVV